MVDRLSNKPATSTFQPGVRYADDMEWLHTFTSDTVSGANVTDVTGNGNTLVIGDGAIEATDAVNGDCYRSGGSVGASFDPGANVDAWTDYTIIGSYVLDSSTPASTLQFWFLNNSASGQDANVAQWNTNQNVFSRFEDQDESVDAQITDGIQAAGLVTIAVVSDVTANEVRLYVIVDGQATQVETIAAPTYSGTPNVSDLFEILSNSTEAVCVVNSGIGRVLTPAEIEAFHENPFREAGAIVQAATGPSDTTLGATENYLTEGLSNPITATYNGIACTVNNSSFPTVAITFPDFDDITGTTTAFTTAHDLVIDDGSSSVTLSVTIEKDAAHFQTVYNASAPPGSIGANDLDLSFGDIFLIRDNDGTVVSISDDSTMSFDPPNYDFDYQIFDVSLNTWSNIINNASTGTPVPGVTGPASTTLGQVETYALVGMSNPVSATFAGVPVTVNNGLFPNVSVTFPDFADLAGGGIALDTAQVLRFDDGSNTVDINVTLAKDVADYQVTYVTPPAAGSIGETETGAVAGDIFLIRDNDGTITNFAADTELTFPGTDYDYDYIWFDVSLNLWSSVTNSSFSSVPITVTGPASTTLSDVESYTLTGMTNPVTATYAGVPVTVNNTSFPNVSVTFPSFNQLAGSAIALDTPQQLRFNDGSSTVDINVTLAKDVANFQTTYAPPPAAGSIGETETGAVAGDIFLIRDNDGTITNFAADTELTFLGTDYDYDYIWYDVSAALWSSVQNNSFTEPGENIMTVSTAVDNSAVGRVVGINTKFKNLRNNAVLFLPQRIAVIGQGATAASYDTTKREVTSALEVAQLYGYGSPLHLAVNQLLPANGRGVGTIPVTVYPLDDDPSGLAATGSITPSGSITEATAYRVSVNNILSEQFVVSPGDSVATIVAAITNAMNAVLDLPVTAVDNTTVVNLTAKWEGVSGNDINVQIIGSQSVGLTYAVVQPSGGLANPDVDVALNQIGNVWETLVLNCLDIADTTALDKYNSFGVGRWGALVRKPLVVFTGNTTTAMLTATTISDGRKADYVNSQLVSPGSNDLPLVVAAAQLARIAIVANNNPPQDYGSQQAPTLTPGSDGDQWLYSVRDAAVKKGSSTIEIKDGIVNISDVVTFYHPDGAPIPAYRYVVDIVKLQNIIYNIDLEFTKVEWSGAPLIPDDQPTVNRSAKKPRSAVAAVASIIDSLGLNAIISDTEAAKNNIQAAINPQNPKRLDLAVTVQLSGNTNIISIDLNFGFFFGTPQVVS